MKKWTIGKLHIPSIVILTLLSQSLFAQLCEVHHQDRRPDYKIIAPNPSNSLIQKTTGLITYIPLQFHVICSTSNTSNWYLDTGLITQAIDTVNSVFIDADIQFCKAGVDIIFNDTFANLDPTSIYSHYRGIYTDTSVIHVYIPEGYGGSSIAGYSFQSGGSSSGGLSGKYTYGGQGNAITIGGWILPFSYQDKWVMSHELGHYFGLRHPSDFTYNGAELVNGTNCDTTADYCCGTPAEYVDIYTDVNCQLIPILNNMTDINGDTLKPDPKNIMSSSGYSQICREYFVQDQIDRIKYFHANYLSHLVCNGTTSIKVKEQSVNDFNVQVHPNPANTYQTITIAGNYSGVLQITLMDLFGRKMKNIYNGKIQTGQLNILVDMQGILPGTYIFKIVRNNETVLRKVVKG